MSEYNPARASGGRKYGKIIGHDWKGTV